MAQSKRYATATQTVDRDKTYPLAEAVKMVKANAKAKFDETIEVAMNLGVDPRHADQMVRGVCALPHGSGRKLRVGVFAKGAKAEEAKKAGADVVGAEDLVEQVQKGVIDFDRFRRDRELPIKRKPSEIFNEHVYGTFLEDYVGTRFFPWWGEKNCMWSNDYPHFNMTFPHSRQVVEYHLSGLSDEKRQRLTHDNAVELFDLKL